MKYIYLIFSGILGINKINCHVTDRAKHLEIAETLTTLLPAENKTQNAITREINDKTLEQKKNKYDSESSVYLDDVLFSLKNQNWSSEEQPCLNHIYQLLYSLQNFTLWAVYNWDAQASEPQGILFGNKFQLGNFDQCMNAPWSKIHPELKTKYCLADIVLERTDKAVRRRIEKPYYPYQSALDFIEHRPPHSRPFNELTWGTCVPAACAPRTVERLLAVMLARSHLGAAGMRPNITVNEPCQSNGDDRDYDALFYTFCGVVGSLFLITLICTYFNIQRKELDPDLKSNFIKSFCLKENSLDLLKMRKEGIEVFYGIRFLTICLIVLDHQIGISNSGPISNGFTTDQLTRSAVGLFILHDDLFVDTFFLLSGFLTMANIVKRKKLPSPLILILRRYVRLVLAFAIIIFYMCAVFPYTGSGPLWNKVVTEETGLCRKNWFLNLLMISNYVDIENMCIVTSWYIPCDFHFFVVTVLAYWLFMKQRHLGLTVAAILGVASIVLPGILTYIYQLPAVQLFTFQFVVNPRGSEEFKMTYIKSHTRYAAYLVGCCSGYVFFRYSKDGNLNRIRQKWSALGACAALTLMLAVMTIGGTFLWNTYHPLEGAVYAALNRPAWAFGVAVLVLCCTFGHVPLVKSFLSWYPWVPLSRLSYGLYLTHPIIIILNTFSTRNPQHNNYFEILTATAGVVFWGCVAALLLWLLVEAPANKLLAMWLTPTSKNTAMQQESNPATLNTNTSLSTLPTGSSGHLHDNFPNTIHFSSKI